MFDLVALLIIACRDFCIRRFETELYFTFNDGDAEIRPAALIRINEADLLLCLLVGLLILLLGWKTLAFYRRTIAGRGWFQKDMTDWKQIVNGLDVGVIRLNENLRVTEINAAARNLIGWPHDSALNVPLPALAAVSPGGGAQDLGELAAAAQAKAQIIDIAECRLKNGHAAANTPLKISIRPSRAEHSRAERLDAERFRKGSVVVLLQPLPTNAADPDVHESRYRALLEAAADIVWITNAEGQLLQDSPSWSKFTGQTYDEFKGWGWMRALHPDDQARTQDLWRQCLADKSDYRTEYRLRTSDGDYRYMTALGTPVIDRDGVIREWIGFNTDISERQRFYDKLAESEERFRQVAALSREWIWEQEPSGRYIYSSSAIADILGYSPQEIIGKHYQELQWPDEDRNAVEPLSMAPENATQFRSLHVYRHKKGHKVITEATGETVLDKQGQILKWRGIERNITEKIYVDQNLRAILQKVPVALLMIDARGVIKMTNVALRNLLGYEERELTGKRVESLIPFAPWDKPLQHPEGAADADGENSEHQVLTALTKTGDAVPIEVGAAPVDYSGEVFTVAAILDLRKRLQAEEVLKKSDQRKIDFLAILGHELRNPLMALQQASELMGLDDASAASRTAYLNVIRNQVADLKILVDDLLDIARLNNGEIVVIKKMLTVEEIISRVRDDIQWMLAAKNQTLLVSLPPRKAYVYGELTRLAQIVVNILHNASKFAPAQSTVWLTVETDDAHVLIKIRDEGKGFSTAMLKNIFESFTRQQHLKFDREWLTGSGGVGLALANYLLMLHDGALTVANAGSDKGGEVMVTLPIALSQEPVTLEEEIQTPQKKASYRFLIVDDHPGSAESLSELLKMMGHEAVYATSGQEGLTLAKTFRPQVALLDLILPDMPGYEIARQMKESIAPGIPLAAITGMPPNNEKVQKEIGWFDAFFLKPISAREIEKWAVTTLANRAGT